MLKEYLPLKIRNKLDFDSLKISNDTFVDKKLKDYFADLLYEVKLKSSYIVPVSLIKRNCTNRLPVYWKKEVISCKR
jgi:S-adenosylmethionine:diacylglycerol 3-amino-3-carboxypropyl transferase